MISFLKYKLFEKKILRELKILTTFNFMMNRSIFPGSYAKVFQEHTMRLSMNSAQGYELAKKLSNLVEKTDIKTIGMLYACFLWLFVYDNGRRHKISNEEDELREKRIEYGLNNFNLVEKHGLYTFAPIDYKKYDEYLKITKNY